MKGKGKGKGKMSACQQFRQQRVLTKNDCPTVVPGAGTMLIH